MQTKSKNVGGGGEGAWYKLGWVKCLGRKEKTEKHRVTAMENKVARRQGTCKYKGGKNKTLKTQYEGENGSISKKEMVVVSDDNCEHQGGCQ